MPVAIETDEEALPAFNDLDFRYAYREFTYDYPSYSSMGALRRGFLRQLARKTRDSDRVLSDLAFCGRCTYPELRTRLVRVQGGIDVCTSCIGAFVVCGSCDVYVRSGNLYRTMDTNAPVCHRCYRTYFRHCTQCDGYYHRRNRITHRHADGDNSCCVSPATKFRVKNNGSGMLRNDKKTNIQLADGEISDEGLEQIRVEIVNWRLQCEAGRERDSWISLSYDLPKLGNQWQTRDGNYAKRLSRFAYKQYGLKVQPKLLTMVGNIARDHSTAVDHTISVTRMLNRSAREFAHPDSCWWTSYSGSRCALKTNGGFGLRTFNKTAVTGRAWVIPLKVSKNLIGGGKTFEPTFNTENPDAFMVFNGYGKLSGYAPARIMSYMNGLTYRKVEFRCDPMYINSGSGYLVGPEELVEKYTDGALTISVSKHSRLFDRETAGANNKETVNA